VEDWHIKKGRKDDPLTKQSDRDLADISPLKLNASLIMIMMSKDIYNLYGSILKMGYYRCDNGEQELAGYGSIKL